MPTGDDASHPRTPRDLGRLRPAPRVHKSIAMIATLEPAALASVTGGTMRSALRTAYNGAAYAAGATNSFVNGFAGGALHGMGATEDQMAHYGDRNAPGFDPGVETGMMFNMALGPVGGVLATMSGSVPTPSPR